MILSKDKQQTNTQKPKVDQSPEAQTWGSQGGKGRVVGWMGLCGVWATHTVTSGTDGLWAPTVRTGNCV